MARSPRVLAAAVVALIAAGCSNAPAETGSAGGEKPAAESSSSGRADSNAPVATGGGGGDQNAPAGATPSPAELQQRREFAKCMRENGVADFPDPTAEGAILYYGEPDQNVFTAASDKCDTRPPGERAQHPGNGG